jgi:hypothetical protein
MLHRTSDSFGDRDLHSGGRDGDAQALGGGVQLDRHAVLVSHLGDTGAAAKSEASPYSGEDAVNVLWSLQTGYSPGPGVFVYADTSRADTAHAERVTFPLEN